VWLKARIVAAGMRPVNNVVDITNFVMWTLGEPMHAFDLGRVAGGKIVVRPAVGGEKITIIDGTERVLDDSMLVIADAEKPTAIAGIMGSAGSEVTEETVDILLEAANFLGSSILKTSMRLGLRSESSTRFEKGLDPELVPKSLAMASRLIVELCGGRLVPGQYDIYSGPPAPEAVHLRRQKLEQVLGLDISEADIRRILTRLGFEVKTEDGEMHVAVPGFRADVSREIDLIEEVARIFGLESIPSTLPSGMRVMGGLSPEQKAEREIARSLKDAGLSEVITYTFIAPDFADTLRLDAADARREVIRMANPISTEQSVMRTAMLPCMLLTVQSNLSKSNRNVNIFEQGRVYLTAAGEKLPREIKMLAGCMSGSLHPPAWTGEARGLDFFTGKGVVEAAFTAVNGRFEVRPSAEPFLHPGKSVDILIGGEPAGYVGEVHPLVLQAYGIDQPAVAFEIDQERLISSSMGIVVFEDIITYPPSYQDIAVVVDAHISAAEVLGVVRESAGPLLRLARVFDVYAGDQLGEGKKSIALNLEFRSPERTLTDEDVSQLREQIVAGLAGSLDAKLRA
jgi:phenylalanyl-tRNA synthetase beta chain